MAYQLSEAYENLYNPRVNSFVDDNLQFIDSMQDEEIEEVVESVYWELRDYGNSLNESLEILNLASSDEIISDAYEEIVEDVLSESRSQMMARRQQAQKGLATQKARLQTDLRRQARQARVTGAISKVKGRVDGGISRVKAAVAGARGGMARAAQELGSRSAEGKARLSRLLRRGISKVQTGVGRVQRAYGAAKAELTGEADRQSRLKRQMRKDIRSAKRRVSGEQIKKELEAPKAKKTPLALPPARTPKNVDSKRRQEALAKIAKAAEGSRQRGTRFAAPGGKLSSKRAHTDIRGQAGRFASRAMNENYDLILNNILDSFVNENYANDYDSALNIFLNLSEDVVLELTEDFLVD